MSPLGQRLRDLDNRVLKVDERRTRQMAKLRTEEGWRKNAALWRWYAAAAAPLLGVALLVDGYWFVVFLGAACAFQAGVLKGEEDRLHKRGLMERLRPPGL